MQITWLGHACFKITHEGYTLVIDPYHGNGVNGYPELHVEADAILISHEHPGHNCREAVKLSGTNKPCPFEVTKFDTFHDTSWGLMRGANTIHLINWDGYKLVHMGDYACGLSDNEKFELTGANVLMISVGGFRAMPSIYTKPLADELCANVVLPMHYAHDNVGGRRWERIEDFIDQYEPVPIVKKYDTNTITITHDTPVQVAVLKYTK